MAAYYNQLVLVLTVSSAPSATPGRSPFEKHVVLPPISAKKSKAGSDVAQEAFMTIPTVQPESVHGQTTAGTHNSLSHYILILAC